MRLGMKLKSAVLFAGIFLALFITAFTVSAEMTEITLFFDGRVYEYREEPVTVIINGEIADFFGADMPPIILDDRVFLPLRELFEALGAAVTWNDAMGHALVTYNGRRVSIRGDSPVINVDGILTQMELPARTINDRLMVPIRLVYDIFGIDVDWCAETRTASVTGAAPPPEQAEGPLFMPPLFGHYTDPENIYEEIELGPIHLELSIDASPEPLPVIHFPKTYITHVDFAADNPRAFYIHANSPITKAERFLLPDNRLVIDIYNSENLTEEGEVHIGSPFLQRIRVAQHSIEPEIITRVVFDLSEPVSFSVTFSEDRHTIIVTLLRNEITGVEFRTDGHADFIYIRGRLTPVVSIFPQTVPGVFIVDIPLGIVNHPVTEFVNGIFASGIRLVQLDPATARVSIDMRGDAVYDVVFDGNTTIIRLRRPTFQNLSFDSVRGRLTIPKLPGLNLDINSIVHIDNYFYHEYTFVLPGDFSWFFGEGNLVIRDRYVSHIGIQTVDGVTQLRFFQQRVMAYVVTEDEHYIHIQLMLPRDKYSRIVIIDPGHGGRDPGRVEIERDPQRGIIEAHTVLDISLRLAQLLEDYGIKVYMTRRTDVTRTLMSRVELANDLGDLFVSIHLNSYYTATPHGSETYWYSSYHNRHISHISERASEILLNQVLAEFGTRDRGTKMHPFRVLVHTTIPAVLIEYAFITNPSDAAIIRQPNFPQRAAEATFRGIQEIFREHPPGR